MLLVLVPLLLLPSILLSVVVLGLLLRIGFRVFVDIWRIRRLVVVVVF